MSATIRLSPGIPSTMSLNVFGSIGSPPEPPLPINCFTMGSSAAGAGAGAGAAGAGAAGAGAGAGGFGLGFWFGFGSGLGSGSGGSGCSSREAKHPMEAQHLMEAQHPKNRSEFDAVHMSAAICLCSYQKSQNFSASTDALFPGLTSPPNRGTVFRFRRNLETTHTLTPRAPTQLDSWFVFSRSGDARN
jgi:hypothetical protein